jgi:hypothetical protein
MRPTPNAAAALLFIALMLGANASQGAAHAPSLGIPGDLDGDGDVDLVDYLAFPDCMMGPGVAFPVPACATVNFPDPPAPLDNDIDLRDFRRFSNVFDPPLPPAGDNCAAAIPLKGAAIVQFDNTGATLDGSSFPGCVREGQDQIDNDLWYCFNAECNGMILVETCERTDVDTKIAVYDGCQCPADSSRLVACDDDGCGVQSRATFQTQIGASYLIRIGNFPLNEPGSGSFRVSCGFDACPGQGDCFSDNATPGCANRDCCNRVCAADPVCCKVVWDFFCAAEADGLCMDGFDVCGSPISGSCRTIHTSLGCNDAACCDAVCAMDTACCIGEFGWDKFCVEAEASICRGACVNSVASCFSIHASPGCNDPACCAEVCPRETFCCQTEWDMDCVDLANQFCD